nr:ArsA-related P-loop ATPase [Nakamurella antarctica]
MSPSAASLGNSVSKATTGTSTVRPLDIDALILDPETKIVITCGSGGVGKTTTAAAIAIRAADAGRRTAVLTIDPAKRLAQSLGLDVLDNTPRRVDIGSAATGELWAMMLDTRRTFDDMVTAHSAPERAAQIFENPFYQTISSSFSGTQEYMAMEKLGRLAATEEWDLIVVDTPPSRSALDFLDAPQRLSSFLDGRTIRLLTSPGRGVLKIVGAGFALFTKAVTAVIGGRCSPMPQNLYSSSRTCLAVFGRELMQRTNCCAMRERHSWSSPLPRPTHCARPRTSPTDCSQTTCHLLALS